MFRTVNSTREDDTKANASVLSLLALVTGCARHISTEPSDRSRHGTQVAALFYSLIESAKLSGVEPKRYGLRATSAVAVDRTPVTLRRNQP